MPVSDRAAALEWKLPFRVADLWLKQLAGFLEKVRPVARHLSVYGLGQIINPKRLEATCSATEEDPGGR